MCYKIIKVLLNLSTINCSELFHFCLKVSSCLYVITDNFLFREWEDVWSGSCSDPKWGGGVCARFGRTT